MLFSASFKTLLKNSKDQARQLLSDSSSTETALAVRRDSCDLGKPFSVSLI